MSSAAVANPVANPPSQPAGTVSAKDQSANASQQTDQFVPIDLSKYDLRHHLLHASLSGPNRLEEYSLSLGAGRRLVAHARFGEEACGHPHIVHGGAIASLLDDSFGTLFLASGLGSGFTANLNVNYRKPIAACANVVVHAAVDKIETSRSGSKKVFVLGKVVDAKDESVVYTEATALFICKSLPEPAETVASGVPLSEALAKVMSEASAQPGSKETPVLAKSLAPGQ